MDAITAALKRTTVLSAAIWLLLSGCTCASVVNMAVPCVIQQDEQLYVVVETADSFGNPVSAPDPSTLRLTVGANQLPITHITLPTDIGKAIAIIVHQRVWADSDQLLLKEALTEWSSLLSDNSNIAILSLGSDTLYTDGFTRDHQAIDSAANAALTNYSEPVYSSSLVDSIRSACALALPEGAITRRSLLLITDGGFADETDTAWTDISRILEESNASLYVIGLGTNYSAFGPLENRSRASGGYYVHAALDGVYGANINQAVEAIRERMQGGFIISASLSGLQFDEPLQTVQVSFGEEIATKQILLNLTGLSPLDSSSSLTLTVPDAVLSAASDGVEPWLDFAQNTVVTVLDYFSPEKAVLSSPIFMACLIGSALLIVLVLALIIRAIIHSSHKRAAMQRQQSLAAVQASPEPVFPSYTQYAPSYTPQPQVKPAAYQPPEPPRYTPAPPEPPRYTPAPPAPRAIYPDATVAVAPPPSVGSYDKTVSIASDKRIPVSIQITDDAGHTSTRQLVVDERLNIGRAPDCDLVIPDPSVSQHHAMLRAEGGKLTIQDAGSTNGTLLYDQTVRSAVIVLTGSVLKMGNVTLTIRY